jgi:hypothetical protein
MESTGGLARAAGVAVVVCPLPGVTIQKTIAEKTTDHAARMLASIWPCLLLLAQLHFLRLPFRDKPCRTRI